jgi:hypothetical protein
VQAEPASGPGCGEHIRVLDVRLVSTLEEEQRFLLALQHVRGGEQSLEILRLEDLRRIGLREPPIRVLPIALLATTPTVRQRAH